MRTNDVLLSTHCGRACMTLACDTYASRVSSPPLRSPLATGDADAESPYTVLGVTQAASADEIRRAYQALARRHHPDRAGEEEAAAFLRVQRAYDQVREPNARWKLDVAERAARINAAGAAARVFDVDLGEMSFTEEVPSYGDDDVVEGVVAGVWRYPCRCGDEYELHEDQLEAGIQHLTCRSCSLSMRPLYQTADQPAGPPG